MTTAPTTPTARTTASVQNSAWGQESTANQWNLGSGVAGVDAVSVWPEYTGAGVRVAVVDDGFDLAHGEIASGYNTALDKDFVSNDMDASASGTNNHGTAVMGIIGADHGGTGMRGVASDAETIGVRIGFDAAWNTAANASAVAYAASVADVVNMSWGSSGVFGDNYASSFWSPMKAALLTGTTLGRDGLGTIFVTSAGNGRASGDNTNHHNMKNDPGAIVVAATNAAGDVASFSTGGASILVAAPGDAVLSTDRTGAAGYVAGDFALVSGTSFAAPTVSGVIALMLEANPDLGYRDVQEILALTAVRTATNTTWATNGSTTWNGGGMHTSPDLGFGLVDARAAVRLAEVWLGQQTAANDVVVSATNAVRSTIADNATVVSPVVVPGADSLDHVETVQVALDISHARPSDVTVTLTSPSGTVVTLIARPSTGTTPGTIVFETSATAFRGEQENGTWTLRVTDNATGSTGTLNSWTLKLLGDAPSADTTYVYTDEYGTTWTAPRSTVSDANGGVDTLMMAALSGNASVDLNAVAVGSVAGRAFSVAAGTDIERLFLGDGNDTGVGNALANLLHGGRGVDTLSGGAGDDSLVGGQGQDVLTGGSGQDAFVFERREDAGDTVADFSTTQGDRVDPRPLLAALGWTGTLEGAVAAGWFAVEAVAQGTRLVLTQPGQAGVVLATLLSSVPLSLQEVLGLAPSNGTPTPAPTTLVVSEAAAAAWGAGATWGSAGTVYQVLDLGAAIRSVSVDLATGRLTVSSKTAAAAVGVVVQEVQGGVANDTLVGGTNHDRLFGNTGNDSLRGAVGNDTLDGGAGDDKMYGDAGNDSLVGGVGNDALYGGDGVDAVSGGDGTDALYGDAGADALLGGLGNDALYGGSENDVLGGEDGDDNLSGGLGNDTLDGGTGNDALAGDDGNDSLTGGAGNDKLLAGNGDDMAMGGEGNDSIDGGAGNDMVEGGTGNDTLVGGTGNDTLKGGAGADTLTGGTGADVFRWDTALEGGDTVADFNRGEGDTLDFGPMLATLGYTGANPFADGWLEARPGATGAQIWLTTASGAPGLVATLSGLSAFDTALLSGPVVADTTYAFKDGQLAAFPTSVPLSMADTNGGGDTFDASALTQGASINLNANTVSTLAGGAIRLTSADVEHARGGAGNDAITGNTLANRLEGGAGADTLDGGSGNDVLVGGAGADRLIGGTGSDSFVLGPVSEGVDTVVGFRTSEGDTLDVSGALAPLGLTQAQALAQGVLSLNQVGAGSWLVATLPGVGPVQLAFLEGLSGATLVANLFNASRAADLPMLVATQATQVVGAGQVVETWGTLTAAAWSATPNGLLQPAGSQGLYDLSQVAGPAVLNLNAAVAGTLGGKTLGFTTPVDALTTGAGADNVTGTGRAERFDLGAGNDTLDAGAGNDSVLLGLGDDSVRGGLGDDALWGGSGHNRLFGDDGADRLFTEEGNDLLDGGAGNDHLWSGAGNDTLTGGTGDDLLSGQDGVDSLSGGAGNDTLDGGAGNDVLAGDDGNDALTGGDGNDRLTGGNGDDVAIGGEGNDSLDGGAGSDVIQGGGGADVLTGGTGVDVFRWTGLGEIGDTVADFKRGEGDALDFAPMLATLGYAGTNPFGDGWLEVRPGAAGAQIWLTAASGAPGLVATLSGLSAFDTSLLSGALVADTAYAFKDGQLGAFPMSTPLSMADTNGGVDTLDASALTQNVSINFNANAVSLLAGGAVRLTSEVVENAQGGAGNDAITGNTLANRLEGGAGADTLDGGSGNDVLVGGAGSDRLIGGLGADTVFLGPASEGLDTLVGFKTSEGDKLDVSATLAPLGLTQAASLAQGVLTLKQAGAGSWLVVNVPGVGPVDIAFLEGVSGATSVANLFNGLRASDLPMLVATQATQAVGAGQAVEVWSTLSAATWAANPSGVLAPAGTAALYDLSQIATPAVLDLNAAVAGTLGGKALGFGAPVDALTTGAGADRLTGTTRSERFDLGGGNDTLDAGAGNDTVYMGLGDDSARGGLGDDALWGGSGHNRLYGDDGADRLSTEAGNDLLDGGAGNDQMWSGAGDDQLYGGLGDDGLWGQDGADKLYGGDGQDALWGEAGADLLDGGAGNDVLWGGDANDSLLGGAGNDTLGGGAGLDRLSGSTGADVFVFRSGEGLGDTITDFKRTEGDRLDITDLLSGADLGTAGQALAAGDLRLVGATGGAWLEMEGPAGWEQAVFLQGVAATTVLDAGWFA